MALIVLEQHKKFQRAHRSANMCFDFLKLGLEMPFLHILLSKINVWTRYDLIRCPFSRYYGKPVRAKSFSKLDNCAAPVTPGVTGDLTDPNFPRTVNKFSVAKMPHLCFRFRRVLSYRWIKLDMLEDSMCKHGGSQSVLPLLLWHSFFDPHHRTLSCQCTIHSACRFLAKIFIYWKGNMSVEQLRITQIIFIVAVKQCGLRRDHKPARTVCCLQLELAQKFSGRL